MINSLTVTLFFILHSTSLLGQDTTYFDSEWKAATKDKYVFYRLSKKENNQWLVMDYFKENNKLQYRGYYKSLDPEIKTGEHFWYYGNGKVERTVNYVDGKEEGESKEYHESTGKLSSEANFKNGQIEGEFRTYHESTGKLSSEANFKNGQIEGEFRMYHESTGKIRKKTFYKNGLENGIGSFYREDGSVLSEVLYKNGKQTISNLYDESGILKASLLDGKQITPGYNISGRWTGSDGVVSVFDQSGAIVSFSSKSGIGTGYFDSEDFISVEGINYCSEGEVLWAGLLIVDSATSISLNYKFISSGCGSSIEQRGNVALHKID